MSVHVPYRHSYKRGSAYALVLKPIKPHWMPSVITPGDVNFVLLLQAQKVIWPPLSWPSGTRALHEIF